MSMSMSNNNNNSKIAKYDELASIHIFYPVAIETGGTWNHWAIELVQEIGRQATLITGEPRESTFLFQKLSVALQRENAVAFLNTFNFDSYDAVAVIPCLVQCLKPATLCEWAKLKKNNNNFWRRKIHCRSQ